VFIFYASIYLFLFILFDLSFLIVLLRFSKIVFIKTMVDLKSCDIPNSITNSSLTKNVEEPTLVSRDSSSNLRK
jgi:hypothetical protein